MPPFVPNTSQQDCIYSRSDGDDTSIDSHLPSTLVRAPTLTTILLVYLGYLDQVAKGTPTQHAPTSMQA